MRRADRIVTVDTDEVTAQVVFPTERPPARMVWTDMRLQSVRIVCPHVCLQIVRTGKGCYCASQSKAIGEKKGRCTSRADSAPVLLAWVTPFVILGTGQRCRGHHHG